MRYIFLVLFIIFNSIAIFMTLNQPLTISYFSLRIIGSVFTCVFSIFLFLLRTTRMATVLSLLSIVISLIHIILIAHSAYVYLY